MLNEAASMRQQETAEQLRQQETAEQRKINMLRDMQRERANEANEVASTLLNVGARVDRRPRTRSPRGRPEKERGDEPRGKYRCGRCGKRKVNHVCLMQFGSFQRSMAIQVSPHPPPCSPPTPSAASIAAPPRRRMISSPPASPNPEPQTTSRPSRSRVYPGGQTSSSQLANSDQPSTPSHHPTKAPSLTSLARTWRLRLGDAQRSSETRVEVC